MQIAENKTEKRLLTIQDAALYLSTTPWCVRALIWDGSLPFCKFGKRHLLDVRDLDALIDREKQQNLGQLRGKTALAH